jgi:hypothetical protein
MSKEAKPAKKKAPVKAKEKVDYGAKLRERLKVRFGKKKAKK